VAKRHAGEPFKRDTNSQRDRREALSFIEMEHLVMQSDALVIDWVSRVPSKVVEDV
jgi:hypothetical protein